jgi:hypothetical protein
MKRRFGMMRPLLAAVAVAMLSGTGTAQEARDPWTLHEWGTFTSLQTEQGSTIGWINTEDEPVPAFVHRLRRSLLVPIDDLAPVLSKGAPEVHPDVLVRLETPVVYFHPPKRATLPVTADLRVQFRGGWLTEYYPMGQSVAPGLDPRDAGFGRIRADAVGSLEWKGLKIGSDGGFPETKAAVWLAPRNVRAAPITASNGESERFLFYRGVGYLTAPLAALQTEEGASYSIRGRLPTELAPKAPMRIPRMWLADIRENGSAAFRALPAATLPKEVNAEIARVPARFGEDDYSPARMLDLRKDMREGLIADGLFADEAEALLNTWQASYFQAAGLRLFFLVPRAWTDHVLPLTTTLPCEKTRVMIGRLELVTQQQRNCLSRIAMAKECSAQWYFDWMTRHPEAVRRHEERRREGDLQSLRQDCVTIPDNYLAYLELGRFRNALVLDEYRNNGSAQVLKFIKTYDLAPSRGSPR